MGKGAGSTKDVNGTVDIDAGTLATIDTPAPGTIGLDAHSGGSSHGSPSITLQVLGYARRHHGERIGDGQCFALADRALSSAGARSAADYGTVAPDADYTWGTSIGLADLQPGDIIQFRDYRYDREVTTENANGSTTTDTDFQERPHHTAIVESVQGGEVVVLEQNAPDGSAVRRSHLFFTAGTTTSGRTTTTIQVQGTFWFYRPQPK
jgi:hypothetical protein